MSIHIEQAQIKQCGVKADALYRVVLAGVEPRTGSSWVEMWIGRGWKLVAMLFYCSYDFINVLIPKIGTCVLFSFL